MRKCLHGNNLYICGCGLSANQNSDASHQRSQQASEVQHSPELTSHLVGSSDQHDTESEQQ